jgi:hypothetical protein
MKLIQISNLNISGEQNWPLSIHLWGSDWTDMSYETHPDLQTWTFLENKIDHYPSLREWLNGHVTWNSSRFPTWTFLEDKIDHYLSLREWLNGHVTWNSSIFPTWTILKHKIEQYLSLRASESTCQTKWSPLKILLRALLERFWSRKLMIIHLWGSVWTYMSNNSLRIRTWTILEQKIDDYPSLRECLNVHV